MTNILVVRPWRQAARHPARDKLTWEGGLSHPFTGPHCAHLPPCIQHMQNSHTCYHHIHLHVCVTVKYFVYSLNSQKSIVCLYYICSYSNCIIYMYQLHYIVCITLCVCLIYKQGNHIQDSYLISISWFYETQPWNYFFF